MLTPLALFLGLLLATAFIAHWSDNLGKKLGKKRVSVFGLRPRTSATILTVVSSWGIMIFTLVALLAAVAPLRRALFRYDAVRAQKAQADEDLKTAQIRLENAQQQRQSVLQDNKELVHDNKALAQEKRNALNDVQLVRTDLSTARTNLNTAKQAAATSQKQAQTARQAVRAAEAQRRKSLTELTFARNQLSVSQIQLSQTKANLSKGQADVKRAQANLRIKQTQVKAAEGKLKNAQQSLKIAVDATLRARAAAFKQGAANIELGRQNIALAKQYDQLTAKAQAIAAQSNFVEGQLYEFALNDIRLPVDQTLSERRIDGGQSSLEIEKELKILLDSSKRAASAIIPQAKLRAEVVVPDADTQAPIQLDQTQTLQLYARLLARANRPVSARIAPIANYPANTPEILARFVFIPIRTIYISRENIASATIDTSKNESAIFGQLQRLVELARVNAVKHGCSPPLSPEEVNFFDGDTGQKLFEALRQVQKVGHPVEVRVVAARDLDSAEPLQIRFLVGEQTV